MRKPVNEIAALQTRDAIWHAIKGLSPELFTARDVHRETGCSRGQVDDYIKALVAAGYLAVDRAGDAPGAPNLYRLERDCGREAPRVRRDGSKVTQGLGREQMWRTMRILGEFTALDLAVQASTEEVQVKPATAVEYCRFLALAGYLAVVSLGHGTGRGGVASQYRLRPARHTGPLPPMIQRVKQVYDPNLNQVVWSSTEGCHDTE